MNTFYNLNTNFVRIYGDVVYIPFFLYPQSLAKKPPFPSSFSRLSPYNWQRLKALFNDLNSKKVQQRQEGNERERISPPLLNSPSKFFLNNELQDQSLHLPLCFHSDLPWSRAFRCRRGIRSGLENRPILRLSSRAIIACREVLSVAALIAAKGCDNVRNECGTLTDLCVCESEILWR